MTVLRISKLQGFVWKTMQAWLDGKSCFPHTNASTFGGRCNRYFWDIRLKILRLHNFNMLFANKLFQKWTVFVFTKSWSRDEVMSTDYLMITKRIMVPSPCFWFGAEAGIVEMNELFRFSRIFFPSCWYFLTGEGNVGTGLRNGIWNVS